MFYVKDQPKKQFFLGCIIKTLDEGVFNCPYSIFLEWCLTMVLKAVIVVAIIIMIIIINTTAAHERFARRGGG